MDVRAYIASGIIEEYVLGSLSEDASAELERLAAEHDEIRLEIDLAAEALEQYLNLMQVKPPAHLRSSVMNSISAATQTIDLDSPPRLTKHADHEKWMQAVAHIDPPDEFENIHLHQLVADGKVMMAKAWVKQLVPAETHNDLIESFLILEGTCECFVGEDVFKLGPGDYLEIPLHVSHNIKVTSETPVVAILQRLAA